MDFQEVFNANKEDKIIIAKKAASLIQDNDVIFIDSGSTCFYMIDYIKAKEITVVTNGIMHIQKLMAKRDKYLYFRWLCKARKELNYGRRYGK